MKLNRELKNGGSFEVDIRFSEKKYLALVNSGGAKKGGDGAPLMGILCGLRKNNL